MRAGLKNKGGQVGAMPSAWMRGFLIVLLVFFAPMAGCLGGAVDDLVPERKGIPGGLTLACLQDDRFTSMVVEIDYEAGYKPLTSSTDMLLERLESVCAKPNGITLEFEAVNFDHDGAWSDTDVRTEAWAAKSGEVQDGGVLRWQLIFPAGEYDQDGVLGVAVDASTVALFGDTIQNADGPFGRPSVEDVENSVIVHEVGHLLGLVNLVYTSPVDHEDDDHPGHSSNEDSVMYWAVNSADLANIFFSSLPNEFDENDLADLAGLADGSVVASDQLWT